jgi:HEAT repeat protein
MRTFPSVCPSVCPPACPSVSALVAALVLPAALLLFGCAGDPDDPMTWAKQLSNLRTQKEALDHLANMDVEKARPAVPALIELYKDTRRQEHLEALTRYKDERTKPIMIEALDYSDDDFDRATVAAGALGDMKATDAVDALIKAAEKPLPVKSRANNAKLAAMRALVRIGDKRATPTLTKVLGTSADEQDFALNQKAALGLAEMRDPAAIPALLKGLFMTGRGANIFHECRLALVRLGAPAIDPLIELLNEKNADIQAMAKQLKFEEPPPVGTPGVVPKKAAILLGDLRARKAVAPLQAKLKEKQRGDEHMAMLIALGFIGDPAGVDTLIAKAKDTKADFLERNAAADGLYLAGDSRAVPTLFELAKSGYVTIDGQKGSNLRASAAIDFGRIAGADQYDAFKALAAKETEAVGKFAEALDRMAVAKECGKDVSCYGQKLSDPSWTRAEKAAFAIAFSGDSAKGIPLLIAAMKPLASVGPDRFPVHQAILYAMTRLGSKSCKECIDKLEKQIERDEKATRIPGARDLLGETRVALAVIQNKDQAQMAPVATSAAMDAAAGDSDAPATKGKKKGAKPAGKKKGSKKK